MKSQARPILKSFRNVTAKSKRFLLIAAIVLATELSFGAYQTAKANGPTARTLTAGNNPSGDSKVATLDGVKIHYMNYGKGKEALVLIHGWSQDIESWHDQIPEFAKRNRVIAIDLPGHGQSDKPKIAYTMDLFARAIDAVLRDAKVQRAVLVGHSMGTPVARQFYRKYPDKTLAIAVVDGPLLFFWLKQYRRI